MGIWFGAKKFNSHGVYFNRQQNVKRLKHKADKKRKSSEGYKTKRQNTKFKKSQASHNSEAYGPSNSKSVVENDNEILDQCIKYFESNVCITPSDMAIIEKNTVTQSDCNEWFLERRKRITASNFVSVKQIWHYVI